MDTSSHQNLARALAEIVHEELLERRTITLEGWGTFTLERRSGATESRGRTVTVHPPKDTIIFESERL